MSVPSITKPLVAIPFNRILTPVEHANMRFLILDCPTDSTLPLYLAELTNRGVTTVVRVCEPTYNKAILEASGIAVHDWPFKDGGIPGNETILAFLALCDDAFGGLGPNAHPDPSSKPCIAVHCVAGLGRAPILVALALIEAGMTPIDTVEFVRQRRRGALNTVQLQFLMDVYKRQWHKKGKKRSGSPDNSGGFKETISRFFSKKE